MQGRAVFLCTGVRTPIGRYGGALAKVRADDLAAHPLKTLVERLPTVDWDAVDEVIYGCVNQAGEDNRNVARMALLLAGLPISVPGITVNRLCASGLDAVIAGSRAIAAGEADLVVAGGVESMTRSPFVMGKAESAFSRNAEIFDTTIGWRFVNPAMQAEFGTHSMPETAENVADEHQISRADQDAFAWRSQQRYAAAKASGFFEGEIASITLKDRKGETVIAADEHPRPDASLEALASLKPVVHPDGTVTAGNASGVNDGAAALLLASEAAVARFGLEPLARIEGGAAGGVPPRVMGVGPIPAVEKLTRRLEVRVRDFDVVELNEAFAAQALACTRAWGLPDDAEHLNPHGGAIALGHPLGASGARLALTVARALKARGGKRALATMCVGVGQGAALALAAV
ncbi:3-oxoadipyl-CoA thiolase [Phenylobacterium deserti]|uniref:Beta-ketoadipyl-CoA thiolase n=1 Tax=Phenylobacterium deserti TaxID=1914756 RepID=A0A328ATW0_9CAUL|nr:3-oxoadipyl-CoA thiolase [Phenylobacterium deserti]RAK57999.1 3-oxoadipyl-CoA thiolase [Phenylobacterium deserti]